MKVLDNQTSSLSCGQHTYDNIRRGVLAAGIFTNGYSGTFRDHSSLDSLFYWRSHSSLHYQQPVTIIWLPFSSPCYVEPLMTPPYFIFSPSSTHLPYPMHPNPERFRCAVVCKAMRVVPWCIRLVLIEKREVGQCIVVIQTRKKDIMSKRQVTKA